MKTITEYLGKVSITCNGKWDINRQYDRLCLVHDGFFASYISKKEVPVGTPLTNEEYWQPVANLREDVALDIDKFKAEIIRLISNIQTKLKSARITVVNEDERNALTYLEVAPGCEVYVLDTKQTWILDSIVVSDQINVDTKEWHLEADGKIDSEEKYEIEGTFDELISDRAIADANGNIIHDTYISKFAVNNYVNTLINDWLKNFNFDVPEGSITYESLSEQLKTLISQNGGTIVNMPDEEDLTVHNDTIKFKDRPYMPGTYRGLGHKILRMNYAGQLNLLEQSMFSDEYTVYEIRYNYNLDGQTINLPERAIINFLPGGTVTNGRFNCNNNIFISPFMKEGLDVLLDGTYKFFGSQYDCPVYKIATDEYEGLVKVGYESVEGSYAVKVDDDGNIYVDVPNASSTADGLMSSEDKDKLDNIDVNKETTWQDITGKPEFNEVATSGDYTDLVNTPNLSQVATSGDYDDLTNKPNLATVATSGSYNDLTNKPTIPPAYSLPVASSSNLGGVKVGEGLEIEADGTLNCTIEPGSDSVSWTNITGKPSFSAVATSGSYNDLSDKPQLATVSTSGNYNDLSDKPDLKNVATSGSYNDLIDKPELKDIATSGDYNDLTNTPNFATINGQSITNGGDITIEGGGDYTLPTASDSILGGVKIGDNITIGEDGVISVSDKTIQDVARNSTTLVTYNYSSFSDVTKILSLASSEGNRVPRAVIIQCEDIISNVSYNGEVNKHTFYFVFGVDKLRSNNTINVYSNGNKYSASYNSANKTFDLTNAGTYVSSMILASEA